CFSSHAPRKAQPRKQEQQVNNVTPTASAIKAAASNVDVVENGIHEEEGATGINKLKKILDDDDDGDYSSDGSRDSEHASKKKHTY
ncbi:hypothetical protein Tco_1259008, partial [Tanacetum coccineum]